MYEIKVTRITILQPNEDGIDRLRFIFYYEINNVTNENIKNIISNYCIKYSIPGSDTVAIASIYTENQITKILLKRSVEFVK